MSKKEQRKRRTKDDILHLLQQFADSELSTSAFCKQQQISVSSFGNWQRRYRELSSTTPAPAAGFTDLLINSTQPLFAEVNGIRIYQLVEPAYLKALQ